MRASPFAAAASIFEHAELGESDAAFEWLERAFIDRDSELVSLRVDPAFDGVRAQFRFQDLIRRMGF
jgi:hypothetical protein